MPGGGFRFFLCTPYLFVSTKDCHLLTVTAVTELLMMVMKVRMLMMTTGDIEQYLAIVIKLHQLFNYKFPKTQIYKSAETQLPRWLTVFETNKVLYRPPGCVKFCKELLLCQASWFLVSLIQTELSLSFLVQCIGWQQCSM